MAIGSLKTDFELHLHLHFFWGTLFFKKLICVARNLCCYYTITSWRPFKSPMAKRRCHRWLRRIRLRCSCCRVPNRMKKKEREREREREKKKETRDMDALIWLHKRQERGSYGTFSHGAAWEKYRIYFPSTFDYNYSYLRKILHGIANQNKILIFLQLTNFSTLISLIC